MSYEAERGTSRSGFLKQAAGASIAVAGAGVGAGALASSAGAASGKSYTGGRFQLFLDDGTGNLVSVGSPAGFDGGTPELEVIADPPGSDGVQRYRPGRPVFGNITFQVGARMGKPMYDWIKASFDHKYERKSGAIHAADSNRMDKGGRAISTMQINSVTIPALDAASKDPAYLAVGCTVSNVTDIPASGQPVDVAKQKHWVPSNYVFEIDGVDTSRVAKIDSFTWKCSIAADGSAVTEVSRIKVKFPWLDAASPPGSWARWYQNLANGVNDERNGTLTLGSVDGAALTFHLLNLGLVKLGPDPSAPTRRFNAELYCEEMVWDSRSQVWL
jgi:hypothetical protein